MTTKHERKKMNEAIPHPSEFLDICIPVENYHGSECPLGHEPGKYSPWFEDRPEMARNKRNPSNSVTVRNERLTCSHGHALALNESKDDPTAVGWANTYFRSNGARECKPCRNRLKREAYADKYGY